MSERSHRLPDTVRPQRYDLELSPNLAAAVFDGTVRIHVELAEPTSEIVLHALDLEIDAATVETASGTTELDHELDPDAEMVVLGSADELPAGPAVLEIGFRGELNDQLVGFYRSTFELTDPDTGDTTDATLAVTQFESTHARRAFPCFDEPAMKAVFAVTLTVPEDQFVVANTAELDRSPAGDGKVRDQRPAGGVQQAGPPPGGVGGRRQLQPDGGDADHGQPSNS